MSEDHIPSKHVLKAVEQLSSLPSVGRKSALRLVLHMLKWDADRIEAFANSMKDLATEVKYCERCFNLSDSTLCNICASPHRNQELICIVETIKDVMAIEATKQFNGLYHVLGGVISPLEGIGPSDVNIDSLLKRVQEEGTKEVILALNATMEGDTTAFYLHKKLNPLCAEISTLARGISFGDELEYADEISLGRSIQNRTPFDKADR
ncbi:recombination mediator RecR [Luteibaculum oceani]|uniref:Recombination protein RecR n=1 Tax=Luteibaculum oceani TaxID=1294296 RepID=A0A5C6VE61_9FLAO|nr:recombination mediator RecR [Luteibaculum oceani]TXC82065.1 recombination protein RecR [Luteibaculum oceani]